MKKRIIVVLGMHRSGTSALTKGLEALGICLGDRLIGADKNNKKGYFEDKDIVAINNELLTALKTDWQSIKNISQDELLSLVKKPIFAEAEQLLTEKLSNTSVLGVKDPRMPRLLPFWKALFVKLDIVPSYIIAYRNPASVVESLLKRDKLIPVKSYYLWLQHMIPSVLDTEDASRLVIDYDRLLADPKQQLNRIEQAFNLKTIVNRAAIDTYANEFLDPSLRHITDKIQLNIPDDKLRHQVDIISSLFQQLAVDELSPDSQEVCKQFKSSWESMEADKHNLDALNEQTTDYKKVIRDLDTQVSDYKHINRELELKVSENKQLVNERDGQIADYKRVVKDREQQIADYKHLQKLHQQELEETKRIFIETELKLRNELQQVLESTSWRLTKPLRSFRQIFISSPYSYFRKFTSDLTKKIWQLLPLNFDNKQKIKSRVFTYTAPLLRGTVAYQHWLKSQAHCFVELESGEQVSEILSSSLINEYVPLLKAEPLINKAARVICLYLPQFHQIPENDEWWGEGFTEWTNVKQAQPQFKGHYQPRIPGELGYYNLLDAKTQQRQVELAKLYGIEGFCFYFYWFAGKTLLEQPIRNYLENRELDLPFCLCWANENWSRRWDGLENEILIAQNYSATDDLEFIQHVAEYMRDDRYIRIDGKPLLVLYRPNLLPDAKKTAQIWRDWCRENNLGEIYLAYTQSFESVDPAVYGFDAAVEFPPNNMAPPLVTAKVLDSSDSYGGQIYDWRVFPERSEAYESPRYKLFRGVNPSWDNTARRKSNSTILYGSSPLGYQKWLFNAVQDTAKRFSNPDERIVFVNAWNEWAEGAHLEPDQRYGYAYLEATRMALKKIQLLSESETKTDANKKSLAIVIHAFYPDVLEEILTFVEDLEVTLKLYVTTTKEQEDEVQTILEKSGREFMLLVVNNHGRDVLPFLKMLPYVKKAQHQVVLKLHTKKSTHRDDGSNWRMDIFEKLMNPGHISEIISVISSDNSAGLVGPEGHIVPMSFYWGSNKERVIQLAQRLGLPQNEIMRLKFIAGTMFYVNVRALEPLMQLAIDDDDFEPEDGEVDGTLAHALERIFPVSAYISKHKLMCTDGNSLKEQKKLIDHDIQNHDYQFADQS